MFDLTYRVDVLPPHDASETRLHQRSIADVAVVAASGDAQRIVVPGNPACLAVFVLVARTAGGVIETRGRQLALAPQTAYVVDPRCEHALTMSSRFAHALVIVPRALSAPAWAALAALGGLPWRLEGGSSGLLAAVAGASHEHAAGIAPSAAPTVARSIVELLNAALAEAVGDRPAPAAHDLELHHRMRIYLHAAKELANHELSVASIAAAVYLSVRRVHQVFASAEMPLMRWVWAERLARCHGRLLAGNHRGQQIGEVAYEWGLNDPAHFSRVFKKRYGHSPSHCVKQATARPPSPAGMDNSPG